CLPATATTSCTCRRGPNADTRRASTCCSNEAPAACTETTLLKLSNAATRIFFMVYYLNVGINQTAVPALRSEPLPFHKGWRGAIKKRAQGPFFCTGKRITPFL